MKQYFLHSKFLILFCFFLYIPYFSYAQCTVHDITGTSSGGQGYSSTSSAGQTFTACQTGEITSITFQNGYTPLSHTVELRIAASPNPATAAIGGPAYETHTNSAGTGNNFTINLNTPFPVVNGNTYAFELSSPSGFGGVNSTTDTYAGGEPYAVNSGTFVANGNSDYIFEVEIAATAAAPAGVPTLSEWGLIILALLLMTMGTLYLVQPIAEEKIG